jgi:hypothetical protein
MLSYSIGSECKVKAASEKLFHVMCAVLCSCHRTSQLSAWYPYFIFRWSWARFSARRWTILTQISFCGFPQFLRKKYALKWTITVSLKWYSSLLWAGWSGVRFLSVTGNFSLHHRVQNGSRAHPASSPMGIRGSFPEGKATGAWSWPLT